VASSALTLLAIVLTPAGSVFRHYRQMKTNRHFDVTFKNVGLTTFRIMTSCSFVCKDL
ncbi:hypothetical protein L9F63_011857, partial [Diploptera punctata]